MIRQVSLGSCFQSTRQGLCKARLNRKVINIRILRYMGQRQESTYIFGITYTISDAHTIDTKAKLSPAMQTWSDHRVRQHVLDGQRSLQQGYTAMGLHF